MHIATDMWHSSPNCPSPWVTCDVTGVPVTGNEAGGRGTALWGLFSVWLSGGQHRVDQFGLVPEAQPYCVKPFAVWSFLLVCIICTQCWGLFCAQYMVFSCTNIVPFEHGPSYTPQCPLSLPSFPVSPHLSSLLLCFHVHIIHICDSAYVK